LSLKKKSTSDTKNFHPDTAEKLSLSLNRKSAPKGDFMAEKGARMASIAQKASIGAFWRLLTPFGESGKYIVICNYFLIFFLFNKAFIDNLK
jgi:hypothetical protein